MLALIFGGTHSGVGKTTVAVGAAAALRYWQCAVNVHDNLTVQMMVH